MINILLSTYNGEKYLKEQLDAILAQTYTDWALFIRDDGSQDNTLSIIENYCKKHPQKIKQISNNNENIGIIRSFELLLKQSQSEHIMFCDQDDVWLPKKIETAINKIKDIEIQNPNKAIVVCSDLYVVDSELNRISDSFWKYSRINPAYLQKRNELAVNNYVTGCTMLFNQKAKEISLPFGKNATMHDFWIALEVLNSNGIINILEKTEILYRQHERNQIGAFNMKYSYKYFIKKIFSIKTVVENNLRNYKQAKEIFNMPLRRFIYHRIIYLMKR